MIWESLYNAIGVPALFVGFRAASKFNDKVQAGIVGRRDILRGLKHRLDSARQSDKTAWFHFTSVGEFEQAKPLIEAIRDDARIVLTYFSPSVHADVARYPCCDASGYLPLDTRRNGRALLEIIKPTLLVFSKFDIWPNLVWAAARQNVPIVLIAGTLHAKSKRVSCLVRPFFRSVHRHIALHCAISEPDAERFRQICPPDSRIEVTGDTRFDRVYQRAMSVEADSTFFPGQATLSRQVFIAGSTYSEDEHVLFETYNLLRQNSPETLPHLILVPHEPTNDRVRQIQEDVTRRGFAHVRFSDLTEGVDLRDTDVIIIDAIGLLAKLYSLGDVVFVGGSFRGSVHNVMEPAAMAKPILFGPTVHNAYEAQILQDRGAARKVNDAAEMASVLGVWLSDPKERFERGDTGKRVIKENLGAAERTLTHLRAYLK